MDPRLSFLIAGVQKGGTTALFDYLSEHPQVDMPSIKEAHFFDNEQDVDWAQPDYAPYHALFTPPQRGLLRGEATPIYIYWPNALERIAEYNPDIRLILIFRDPVQRAWSHWRMEYARGAEVEPFAWCIRAGRARVASDPTAPGSHRVYSYVERGFYGQQLARALSLFPARQILVLDSAELREDPAWILGNVSGYLDIEPFRAVERRESHVGITMRGEYAITTTDEKYLRNIYEEDQAVFGTLKEQVRLAHD